MLIGTVVNTISVVVGASVGLLLQKAIPGRIKTIVFQAMGLVTLLIGTQMALKTQDLLIVIFSLVAGGIIGEAVAIENYLENFGNWIKRKIKIESARFTEGLIMPFLLFCVGPMTIIGTLNEGLKGDHALLFAKSILDGTTSIVFAATYGIGALFSAIPLFVFQSGLTLLAFYIQSFLSEAMINQLTAVGGIMLLGIGINLLDIKKIKVANLLPALVVVVILMLIFK